VGRAEEAYNILKSYTTKVDYATHGEHAGNKIIKLKPTAQIMSKHLVNNVLYQWDVTTVLLQHFLTSSVHHTETSSETVSNRMVLTASPFAENDTANIWHIQKCLSTARDINSQKSVSVPHETSTARKVSQYCTRHQQPEKCLSTARDINSQKISAHFFLSLPM
jgi:hypothetical protein